MKLVWLVRYRYGDCNTIMSAHSTRIKARNAVKKYLEGEDTFEEKFIGLLWVSRVTRNSYKIQAYKVDERIK